MANFVSGISGRIFTYATVVVLVITLLGILKIVESRKEAVASYYDSKYIHIQVDTATRLGREGVIAEEVSRGNQGIVYQKLSSKELEREFIKQILDDQTRKNLATGITIEDLIKLYEEAKKEGNGGPEYRFGFCTLEITKKISKDKTFNGEINFCFWGGIFAEVSHMVLKCKDDQTQKCIDDAKSEIDSAIIAIQNRALK